MEQKRKKILRTQYLINKGFQLKYTAGFIVLVLVLSVFFSIATYSYVQDALYAGVSTGISQSQIASSLAREQATLLNNNILLFFGFFALILVVFSIYMTHRIAGPMFSLKRRMKEVSEGIIHAKPLQFRKTDEFHDVAESFNTMVVSLHSMRKNELLEVQDVLKDMLNALEKTTIESKQLDMIRESMKKIEEEHLKKAA